MIQRITHVIAQPQFFLLGLRNYILKINLLEGLIEIYFLFKRAKTFFIASGLFILAFTWAMSSRMLFNLGLGTF